jgi:hypothetical protein
VFVTDTMKIEIDKRIHTARKINGRWWSEDNRELKQTNAGWLLEYQRRQRPGSWFVSIIIVRWTPRGESAGSFHGAGSGARDPRPAQQRVPQRQAGAATALGIITVPAATSSRSCSAPVAEFFTASYEPDARTMPKDVPHLVFRFNGKSAQESFEEHKDQTPKREIPLHRKSGAGSFGRKWNERKKEIEDGPPISRREIWGPVPNFPSPIRG